MYRQPECLRAHSDSLQSPDREGLRRRTAAWVAMIVAALVLAAVRFARTGDSGSMPSETRYFTGRE
ncbi:hypothetical protein DFR68_1307 [Nocardia mexicana]|uniref:Uncharacterized protein n=1 Tax=Nocardia mexicana TaxID=279262 RepID=A0A370GF78_9NOCA|nr:hypothetical protein DFR68_1307 [Nocardia mexicana]